MRRGERLVRASLERDFRYGLGVDALHYPNVN